MLRRIGREKSELLKATAAPALNTPAWLWDSWVKAYGETRARGIALAHLADPPLDFSVKADPESWAQQLGATILPTGSLRRTDGGSIEALPGFADGAWWIQDAAAALPVTLLGPVAGKTVIDICAAPGGKTAQLAAAGATVTAVDRSAKRLERLTANLTRLGLTAETVTADATLWQPAAPADAVLLDAPCSATGTIRRHPDVAWLKTPEDMAKLVDLQARLLRAAVAMVSGGGTLIYCTCSLQPEEGPKQIASLLADRAPVQRLPIAAAEVGGLVELDHRRRRPPHPAQSPARPGRPRRLLRRPPAQTLAPQFGHAVLPQFLQFVVESREGAKARSSWKTMLNGWNM